MADIFKKNPDGGYLINADEAPVAGEVSTGNDKWDEYLTSLPAEDREEALKRLKAPLTGEELAEKMKRDPDHDIKFEDFAKYEAYKGVQERHLMDDIMLGADGIMEQFGKAIQSAADHPSKALYTLGGSSVEALLQGTRGMVGIAAESQDPSSIFFNMRDVLTGGGTPEARYAQFIKAREFNRGSISLATGKTTMLVSPEYLDHEITQAMSFIADPSWIVPFGKVAGVGLRATGMGEHLALAAARAEHIKHMVVGGTIKYALGKPIEFLGGATRNVIDFGVNTGARGFEAVSGIGVRETNAAVRTTAMGATAANLAGLNAGALADVSGVYLAGTSAAGVGEALGAIGGQVMRGKRGILSYAKAALEADKAILSPQAQSLLKIVNAFDPLVTIGTDMAGGVASGAAVGAVLGYGSDRSEGLGHGIGAGMVLGAVGAVQGRAVASMKGGTTAERLAIQSKYVREGHLQLGNMKEYANYSLLRKFGELTGTEVLMDGVISTADTLIPDVNFEFRNDKEHKKYLKDNNFDPATGRHRTDPNIPDQPSLFEYKNSNGLVMETKDGRVTMHINTEQISTKGTVVPHELFHLMLRKSVLAPKYIKVIAGELLGVRDSTGKMTQGPSVGIADTASFFKEYIKRTYAGKDVPARLAAIDAALKEYKDTGNMTHIDKAINGGKPVLEHMVEEFGAYYFQHLILGERPDWLFFGGKFEGMTGVLDRGASAWKDYWYGKINKNNPQFDFSQGISKGFTKEGLFSDKRIRIPALDYIMQDVVNSTKNLHKSNAFDINALNKGTRDTLIDSQGWDALKRENGKPDVKAIAQARKFAGQQAFKALLAANPNRQLDGEGNIAGRLDVNDIDTLVRTGTMSRAMGDKVLTLQRLADVQGRRPLITFGYLGDTQQYLAGNDQPRLTGKDVSYTNREVALLGFDVKIGKDGKYQFMARTLDVKVIEARGNNQWKQGSVRDLWNGSRADFDSDFLAYLSNASKDGQDVTRRPSAEILPNLDGKGALRRDVMHQMAGFVKESSEAYYNSPIAEVSNDYLASYTHFSAENMGKITETGERWDYNHANAFKDLSKNFMPSEMKFDETPNGKVFSHISGFKFIQPNAGMSQAFDADGVHIGDYKTIAEATFAGKQVHAKQKEGINNVVREIKRQNDNGISYMPKEKFVDTDMKSNSSKYLQNFLRGYRIELGQKIKEMAGAGDEMAHEEHFNRSAQNFKDVNYAADKIMQIMTHSLDEAKYGEIRKQLEVVYEYDRIEKPRVDAGEQPLNPESLRRYEEAKRIVDSTIDAESGKTYGQLYELKDQPIKDTPYAAGSYKKGSKTDYAYKASILKELIEGLENGTKETGHIESVANILGMESLLNEMTKDKYTSADKWEAKYKMGFRSALKDRVLKMIEQNPTWSIDKLRSAILKGGSRGDKLWSEAKAMGLLDYIDSKMRVKYAIVRKLDAKGQPYARGTGQYVEIPQKIGDVKIDVEELTKFINENEIGITIDEGAKANISDTSRYTMAGDKSNYKETAVRISQKYQHGVDGHYGPDTIVHTRTSERFDSDGNKYLYIEEVQANNTDSSADTTPTYVTSKEQVPRVRTLIDKTLLAWQLSHPDIKDYRDISKHSIDTQINKINLEFANPLADGLPDKPLDKSARARLKELGEIYADQMLAEYMDESYHYNVGDSSYTTGTSQYIRALVDKPFHGSGHKGSPAEKFAQAMAIKAQQQNVKDLLAAFIKTEEFQRSVPLQTRYRKLRELAHTVYDANTGKLLLELTQEQKKTLKGLKHGELDMNQWVYKALIENTKVGRPRPEAPSRSLDGPTMAPDDRMIWVEKLSDDGATYELGQAHGKAVDQITIGHGVVTEYGKKAERITDSHPDYNNFSDFSERRLREGERLNLAEDNILDIIHGNPEMEAYMINAGYFKTREWSGNKYVSFDSASEIQTAINDFKSAAQRDINLLTKASGNSKPLTEVQEWAKIALIQLIRQGIRDGVDTLALTHPDDAPPVSNMDYEARHGMYLNTLVPIWDGFLKKFGIKIEKGSTKNESVKSLSEVMAGMSTEVYKNNKALIDFAKASKEGADAGMFKLLAEPVHKLEKQHYPDSWLYETSVDDFAKQSFRDSAYRIAGGTGYSSEYMALFNKAVDAKWNEVQAFRNVKEKLLQVQKSEGKAENVGGVLSEYAIGRSSKFVLNDSVKEAFLNQTDNQVLKAYMPKEDGQGGRTYDYNSKSWLGGFIGRYAAENPEQTKDLSIQLINKSGGVTRLVFTDTSGASKNVGHIEFDKFGGISANIAPEYQGKDLSYLLYSEAGERMRALGIKESVSTVTNKFAIPVKSRERTFGDTMHWQGRGKEGIPITREQAADYIAQKKATQVEEGRSYSGINISNKLEQNKWYMPKEDGDGVGGRAYNPKSKEFKSSFIGRQANENPEIVEGIKLRMKNWDGGTSNYGKRSIELLDGTDLVGRIDYDVRQKTAGNKHNGYMLYDPTVWVEPKYRGKGFSNILYSEMAERARSLGAQDFLQRIENEEALPMKTQIKVFGFGESKLIDTMTQKSYQPTMENFDKLKHPEISIMDNGVETVVKGREPWVQSWSKMYADRWYMPRELAVSGQNPNVKKGFLDYIKKVPHLLKSLTEGEKPEGERKQNYLTIDQFKPERYRQYHFLSHGPDTASTVDFVDALSGETLHRGQGGGNYPSLFPDKGWASTKGMGKSMADEINAIGERNLKERGEWIAPVALLKSDPWKMRGTVNGANGYINTVNKLSERGVLTRKQFKDAIGAALSTDKMKNMGVSKKTLGIDFKNATETQVVDALIKLISNQDMPIATRKVYIEKINAEVFDLIKDKVSKAEGTIPTLKGKTVTQGESFGSALFEMFEDPMTQHAKQGEVYMTLLIRHPVKGESSLQHASYQDTVRTTGGEPIQQDWLSKPIDPKDLFKQRFTKGSITDEAPSGLIDLRPDKDSSFTLFTGQTRQPYQAVKAFQPNEGWRQWTPEKTASGIIYRNLVNYSIIFKDNKFKVYNSQKITLGIYDTLASAQKRVEREEPKEKKKL